MRRVERQFAASTAFALTGVGTALLGVALPSLLHSWKLSDEGGGLLLLASWTGSTAGAFVANRPSRAMPALGLALTGAALFALSRQHPWSPVLLFLLYGLGLGVTMTAISTLQAGSTSQAQAEVAMNRLNLLWAVGACVTPLLGERSLRQLSAVLLFQGLGAIFLVMALVMGIAYKPDAAESPKTSEATVSPTHARFPLAPLSFCLFAASAVGLESALGSWLATYAARTGSGLLTAVSASAAFWAGLLLSRALHSVQGRNWIHTERFRLSHLGAVGLGLALIIFVPGKVLTPIAALICGWGLGPLYPWVLAVALPRFRSTGVFVLAGVGASMIPWMTGLLSTRLHSLQLGLLAPALTFALLLLSRWSMQTPFRQSLRYDAERQPPPGW